MHWVAPRAVAEGAFTEWTSDGLLRHPTFQGLREDKPAGEIVREEPATGSATGESPARSRRKKSAPAATPERQAAAASSSATAARVAGVTLSNPDRVLYPEQGLTKLDLARYYEAVAERRLPHIADRPLTLVRCPRGREQHCFYQKHLREEVPPAVRTVVIREEGGATEPYVYVRDVAGIVSLVQLGVLEFHGWGSRADQVEKPDRLVFDLDPDPTVAWSAVAEAARELRHRLAEASALLGANHRR